MMNILTKIRLLNELNDRELRLGIAGTKASWHDQYKESAWVYAGGVPYELSEGDIICVFSQYGEIVNINLVRDQKTGKSKGFAFICYQDQKSTVLSVDNLNGAKIKGRQIRVDHVMNYKPPKDDDELDELTRHIREEGVAPQLQGPQLKSTAPEVVVKKEKLDSNNSDSEPEVKKRKKKKKKEAKELKFLKKKPTMLTEKGSVKTVESSRREKDQKSKKRHKRSPSPDNKYESKHRRDR